VNPSERGWLKTYLTYHERRLMEGDESYLQRVAEEATDSHHYLYRLIQPTGLMYGYPVTFIHQPHPRVQEWGEREKIKILLTEGFLSTGMYYFYEKGKNVRTTQLELLDRLKAYYLIASTRIKPSKSGKIGGRKNLVDQVEYLLDRTVSFSYDWRNFWNSFFHNTLIFFDLILFAQWMERGSIDKGISLTLVQQQLRLKILKIIAAAAHADGEVTREERELFSHFLASANLPAPKKRQAQGFMKHGVRLQDIDVDIFPSWLMRKYFLELAILTSWANREISPAEEAFLQSFTLQMGLPMSELENSTKAVTGFVLEHWQQVQYLHIRQNYRVISERLTERLRLLVKRNQRMIAQEIRESRELVILLRQSTQRDLTTEEKEKVREQLLDILRTIPAFTIFMLPGGSITLPLLMRIIPKSILYPSSFRENEEGKWDFSSGPSGLFLWKKKSARSAKNTPPPSTKSDTRQEGNTDPD